MDSPLRTVFGDRTNLSSRSTPSPHKQPQDPVWSLLDLGGARGSRRALRLGSYMSPAPLATARSTTATTPRRQDGGRYMTPAVSPKRGDKAVGDMGRERQPSAIDLSGEVKHDSSCSVLEGDSMRSISFGGASGSPYRRLADRPSLNASLGRSLNDSWAFYRAFEPPSSSSVHSSRALVINPTKSVLTIDARTSQILTWNSIAAELLGYTAEELSGLRLKQLLATGGDGVARPQLEETHLCSDAGGVVVFPGTVVELSRKHGAPVAVSLWLRKVNSEAGQRRRCVAVIEPVHRQSVQLESSLTGEMDGCSESAAQFFCLDETSMGNLSVLQLLPSLQLPGDTSAALSSLHQCLSTQNIAGRRPDGSSFPVSVSLSVLPSIVPSTHPQQSDRLLVQVHTYTSLMGLVVINDRLQVVDCNRTFISLTAGYERSALVGQDVRQLIVTFDEDMEMLDSSSDELEDPLFTDYVYDTADIYIEPEQTEERLSVHTQPDLTSTHLFVPPSHSSSSSTLLRPQTEEHSSSSPTLLRPQTEERSSSSPTLLRPQAEEHSSSSPTLLRPQTEERSSSSPTIPRPQTEVFDQNCPIECNGLSKSPCGSRCGPAPLTSTPGSTHCSTAPRTSGRAAPRTQLRDSTYYGMARHSDGSRFGITYDLCGVRLEDGVLLYCLWIGQDRPQQSSQPAAGEERSTRLDCAAAVEDGSAADVDDTPHTAGEYSRYYTTVKQIGNGAFGLVKLSYRNGDRLLVVTKFIRKSKVSLDHWVEDSTLGKVVPLEVSLLAMLRHKNIIGVLDVFENIDYVQLVMERHGCMDLFEFIERDPKLDEALISYIFRQICSAVGYLHHLEIVHRDVKDENVIIDSQFCVKLIDFGSATFVTRGALLNVFCGTLEYCAPEVLAGNKYDGYVMEMWSLGVTLYTTICGQNPFSDVLDIVSQPLSLPSNLSSGLTDVLSGLLDKDPVRRMTMATLMEHPWITQSADIDQYIFSDVVQCSGQELDPARFLSPSRLLSVSGCCESAVRTPDVRRRISQSGSPDITARSEQRGRVRSDETHFRSVDEHCSVNLHQSMYR